MHSSDFIKANNNKILSRNTAEEQSKSETAVVVINGREYFKKQLKEKHRKDLRCRMSLYKEFNVGHLIDSPFIVKYKEINEDENGVFVLMEHVNGMSLAEKIETEPAYFANTGNILKLLRQLLNALKTLHKNNVAYLDLKPENIMLTQISNDVKLVDLGGSFADCNSFTAERTTIYAAPELIKDQIYAVDARADIYGVGKIMEYIEGNAGIKLPKYLQKIRQRCLNSDKEQRFGSADEVLYALNRRRKNIRKALFCAMLAAACAIGWHWYSATEHHQHMDLFLNSDAFVEDVYYAINPHDSTSCHVIGWKGQENLYIKEKVEIDGKEYAVTEIADKAFSGQEGITSVFLPQSLRKIGADAFFECKGLVNVTLPEGLTELGHACFKGTGIWDVSFPKSLKSIGHASFAQSENIVTLIIPEGVETLEMDAFANCTNLVSVQLPSTLKTISRGVFWDCQSLEEIHIPAGVCTIGEYAFFYCPKLKHVYNHSLVPQPYSSIFKRPNITIHVPASSVELYRSAYQWKEMDIVGDL